MPSKGPSCALTAREVTYGLAQPPGEEERPQQVDPVLHIHDDTLHRDLPHVTSPLGGGLAHGLQP
jgi:hypothetical protein